MVLNIFKPLNNDQSHPKGKVSTIVLVPQDRLVCCPLSEFLKLFYNTVAYVFVSPHTLFSTKDDKGHKNCYSFKRSSWSLQLIVGTIQLWSVIATLLFDVYTSRESVWNDREATKLKFIYRVFVQIFTSAMILNLYRTFTGQSYKLASILNKVRDIYQLLDDAGISSIKIRAVKTWFYTLLVYFLLWTLYTNLFIIHKIHSNSLEEIVQACIISSCYSSKTTNCNKTLKEVPVVHLIEAVFMCFGCFVSTIADIVSTVTPLIHSITFYCIASDYKRFLKQSECENMQKTNDQRDMALRIFEEICGLSEMMDEILGPIVAFFCIDILAYFVSLINDVLKLQWVAVTEICIYMAVIGFFSILAAETNSKLGYLIFWLQHGFEGKTDINIAYSSVSDNPWNTNHKISLALNQLQRNQVGIRGRAFTVTYGFVGNMLSLLLSYSILYSQLSLSQ